MILKRFQKIVGYVHSKPLGVLTHHMVQEVEESQTTILFTEEALLEALCFDFVVGSPHAELIDLLDAKEISSEVEDYAWSIANDSSVASISSSLLI